MGSQFRFGRGTDGHDRPLDFERHHRIPLQFLIAQRREDGSNSPAVAACNLQGLGMPLNIRTTRNIPNENSASKNNAARGGKSSWRWATGNQSFWRNWMGRASGLFMCRCWACRMNRKADA